MRADYAEHYRDLYERHWWWRARERFILDTLRVTQPPGGWKRILDVGCGDGLFFDQLAQFGEVEGVEPAEALVSGTGAHRSRIHIGRFDENFQPAKPFSLILFLDVLEHLPDPAGALRHALGMLAPGGAVLVTVPAFKSLWTNHDVINHHLRRYTKATFRQLAQQAGLDIRMEKYFFHWTFPAKLATRVAERALHSEPTPPAVPPRWINGLLCGLTRIEQKTWGRLTLPFGSSLMVMGSGDTRRDR
ncbi:MAG TPA: class I SAM-dependent methyltransferase [Terriglobia bacterium]|nr:class I SAM-dependent methyltransferase [Terriglobia bacterium]